MAYTLGDITLPNPKKFTRKFLETGVENLLMEGRTTKRVENRKEQFVLEFSNVTQAQVNAIFAEYELEMVRAFTVSETNLTIGPTDVLIDVSARDYPPSGELYLENFMLILTEVK